MTPSLWDGSGNGESGSGSGSGSGGRRPSSAFALLRPLKARSNGKARLVEVSKVQLAALSVEATEFVPEVR